MKKLGLKAKLVLSAILLVMISLVVSEVLTYRKTSEVVTRLTQDRLDHELRAIGLTLEMSRSQELARLRSLIQSSSEEVLPQMSIDTKRTSEVEAEDQETHAKTKLQLPMLLYAGKSLENHEVVDRLGRQSATAVTIFAATNEGLLRISTTVKKDNGGRAIQTYIPLTSPIAKAVLGGESYYGRAKVLGKWFTAAYVPIKQSGKVVGAYFMGFPEKSTEVLAAYLKEQKLLKTGYYYILDSKGNFLLHPSLEGKNVIDKTDADGRLIFKEILNQKTGSIQYHWLNAETKKIQPKLAIFNTFPEVDWTVAASVNLDEAMADVYDIQSLMIYVGLLVMMIMAALTWFGAAYLAKEFVAVGARLSGALNHIHERSAEVLTSSNRLASSSGSQAAGVQETAATLEEVRATISSNMQLTIKSEELSAQTAKETENGYQLMSSLTESINGVSSENDKTFTQIKESYAQISKISDVLKQIEVKTGAINDIVFQTKLLSFNASVEAARAGENGKGFSVVAEEIGKLASMTGTTAREINELMTASMENVNHLIQSAEEKILRSFESSAQSVSTSVEIASKTSKALADILERSKQTLENMKHITIASREQSAAVEQIALAVKQIDEGVQETAGSAQKANEISASLNKEVDELSQINTQIQTIIAGPKSAA